MLGGSYSILPKKGMKSLLKSKNIALGCSED